MQEAHGATEGNSKDATAADARAGSTTGADDSRKLEFILDIALEVSVELGRGRMEIQNVLQLGPGSVVELSKLAGEPLDVLVNGRLVARGEAVIVGEKFGVRITEVVSRNERIAGLRAS
jgi:flagellar motor switch protein FliN/FliY